MRYLTLSTCVAMAAAHGSVVNPPPRNAVDKDLPPWNGPVPCHVQGKCPSVETETGWCPVPDKDGKVSGQNGQSCCKSRDGGGAGGEQRAAPHTARGWLTGVVALVFGSLVFQRLRSRV